MGLMNIYTEEKSGMGLLVRPNSYFDRTFTNLLLVMLFFMTILSTAGCRNSERTVADDANRSAESSAEQSGDGQSGDAESNSGSEQDLTGTSTNDAGSNSASEMGEAPAASSAPLDSVPITLSNTPLAPPDQLARAVQLFNNGDYVAVRRELTDLSNEGKLSERSTTRSTGDEDNVEGSSLNAEAQFLLAKSYLANDEYGQTLLVIDPMMEKLPTDDVVRAKMLYLRARALNGLGRYNEAIVNYKEFEGYYSEAVAATQEQIAANFLALGNVEDAGRAYRLAADASIDIGEQVRLLEALAQSYVAMSQMDEAVAVYDEILSVARNSDYRAEILFTAGQTLANAGNKADAITRWQVAMDEAPENKYAYLSLIELVGLDVGVDQFQRGYIDLEAQAYLPAIDAFKEYLDEVEPSDKRAGQAMHYLGQSYLGAGNYEVANQLFERVIDLYPDCVCVGQAWLDLAESQAWLGSGPQARRTYRTFARENSDDALAAEALWRSGLLAFNEGSQLEVAADFFALSDDFPESERAPLALYIVGIGAYREGLTGQAVRVYERMQEKHEAYRPDAVGYWLGRAYFDSDDPGKARAAWRGVVDKIPDTFYGVLSAIALRKPGRAAHTLDDVTSIAGAASKLQGDDGGQPFAEKWLAEWLEDVDVSGVTAELPAAVDSDVDLKVGRVMMELDQRFEALAALERVYVRYGDKPNLLYPLSLEFERLGAYRLSLITMERLIQLSPAELVEDTPIFLQRYVYPRRYPDLVERAARNNNIDPLLYYSLIRQESLFEKGARSYAAAQGLAQIIPDTAQWIADQVAYPDFRNDLVLRPHINLDFGAYYLDWARNYLDNNLISALVGYNAGPGNSLEWRKISGLDDALFVEILSVNEPRLYILKITSNYYHYNRLYTE